MRIQRVVARAFGPFQGRTLDLAPGMTVVAGPNESGKSSWHAALRLAITGVRRGKGPGTAAERQLAERHRPWDQPERWEVEARLQLDDGRLIDISQDLGSRVACRAVDVALGRDVSDEILDGTPDASRWLGLDRDSFASTVSVSQAQVMAVADAADHLQEQMQRAAATRGTDATAAEAIARLEQFRRDAVGADTIAAKGPLRTAKNRASAADGTLAVARRQHAEYLERAAAVERAERDAEGARARLVGAEAALARMQAAECAARAARAVELSARHPAPPPSLATDDALSGRVAGALESWAQRPRRVELTDRSADAIQAEIESLPLPPHGDLDAHPSVMDARRAVARASQAIELLGLPPAVSERLPEGWTATQLRDLARRVEDRTLPEAAALEQELAQMRTLGRSPAERLVPFGLGALAIGAGLVLVTTGFPPAGGALIAAGLAALVFGAVRRTAAGSEESIGRAEHALAPYREAASRARDDRAGALRTVREARLPEDPAELMRLADRVAAAAQQATARDDWEARRTVLASSLAAARAVLAQALAERGAAVATEEDAMAAAEAYIADCLTRAEQHRAAERRSTLASELAARRSAERAASAALERESAVVDALRALAHEIGGDPQAAPEAICALLEAWRVERGAALSTAQHALAEWQQLQALLDGSTIGELQSEAARRRQRANELAARVAPESITLPTAIDPEEHIGDLRRQVQVLERDHDLARGALQSQRDALPDVAEAEEAAAGAQAELDRVERLARTIDATLALLRTAQERVHRDLAPVLAQAVGRWLPVVSRGAYAEASVDPATLQVSVKEAATGQWRAARLLSEGTREQIYLLLRVAMAEHLVSTSERAPLLLDEVTAQADGERKRELLDVLHHLSTDRQVILFTHDDDVLAWADAALNAPTDATVRLLPLRSASAPPKDGQLLPAPGASEPKVPLAVD
jgi:exonuclease SbcC